MKRATCHPVRALLFESDVVLDDPNDVRLSSEVIDKGLGGAHVVTRKSQKGEVVNCQPAFIFDGGLSSVSSEVGSPSCGRSLMTTPVDDDLPTRTILTESPVAELTTLKNIPYFKPLSIPAFTETKVSNTRSCVMAAPSNVS